LIVAASPSYLSAIVPDLTLAKKNLSDERLLIILSAGVGRLEGFEANLIPADARLQKVLGGARSSLNARLADKILRESDAKSLRADLLQVRFRKLLARQPELVQYDRTPMSDDEVRAYVRSSLEKDASGTASRLLRVMRDEGSAVNRSASGPFSVR
jgi:hypothetical protein